MIRPAQVALLERARTFFAGRGDVLSRFPPQDRVAELSASAFEELMDLCTIRGFRDRRRPILARKARQLLDEARRVCRIGDFEWATTLRRHGCTRDVIDLDGLGLVIILGALERCGLAVDTFLTARREITAKQLQLLHVARKKVGLPDPDYLDALHMYGGVNSAADLDERGFTLMLALMMANGFARRPGSQAQEAGLGDRPGFASPAQLGLIRELWREWSGADDEAALVAWLERFHHVSALRFLTSAVAGKVITALRAMKQRGHHSPAA